MFDAESMRQLSEMLDEKFEVNNAKLKKELKAELKAELKTELGEELSAKLKTELGEELSAKLKTELREEFRSEMKGLELKMEANTARLEAQIFHLQDDVRSIKVTIDEELRPSIRILAENYVPAAKRFEASSREIDSMKADIALLNYTVGRHSEQLAQLLPSTYSENQEEHGRG